MIAGAEQVPHERIPRVEVTTSTPGTLRLEQDDRRYTARWATIGSVEQLRVNIRVESGHNGSTRFHVETLDLYSARSRKAYASRAAKLFATDLESIEDDLSQLLIAIDKSQRDALDAAQAQTPDAAKPTMTDAERNEALAFLRADNLLERIAADMTTLGYVGEDRQQAAWLSHRRLAEAPDPLSAIIISQSGAGKSGLATVLEKLVPPEELVFWSRLTPQALYYVERDFLKRKLVLIEERDGSDAADYSIRALQSRHKLVQAVPVKDPATGSIKTRTMEVEGPAAFLETTTRLHINPENASRCFELFLDESPGQTERVHAAQRQSKTSHGIAQVGRKHAIERVHHNAQRLLEPVAVVIPYAPLLTFPSAWLRTRRDNLRLLNLIEASAFLHQHQRTRNVADSIDYIEASAEDYAIAYSLAASVLGFGLDELKKPARELLAVLESKVPEIAPTQGVSAANARFTQREVRTWTGLPHHQVKLAMQELVELEYLEADRSHRGGRNFYRLATKGAQKPQSSGLLSPAQLINLLNDQSGKSGKQGVSTPKRPLNSINSST